MKGQVYTATHQMSVSSPQLIRFGHFEVDTRSGELRRQGSKVNLQETAVSGALLLLNVPASVTREELNKRLWPETPRRFRAGLNKSH